MKKSLTLALGLITVLALVGCGKDAIQPVESTESSSIIETPTEETERETDQRAEQPTEDDKIAFKTLSIQTHLCIEDCPKDLIFTNQTDFDNFSKLYDNICESEEFINTFDIYKGYFLDNIVIVHMELVGSGSDTFEITDVDISDVNNPHINVKNTTPAGAIGTCDMATWFFFAEVPNSELGEESIYTPFTDQELDDMQAVDDAISSIIDDMSFYSLSKDERKNIAEEKLNELVKQGLISDVRFDEQDLFMFKYKCGIEGGMYITSDQERYYIGDEAIN